MAAEIPEELKKKYGLDTPEKEEAFKNKYMFSGPGFAGGMTTSLDMSDGAAASENPPETPPAGMSGMTGKPNPAVGYALNTSFGPSPSNPPSSITPVAPTENTPEDPATLAARKKAIEEQKAAEKAATPPVAFGPPTKPENTYPVYVTASAPGGGGGSALAAPPAPPPWWKSFMDKYPDLVREHIQKSGDFAANEAGLYADGLAKTDSRYAEAIALWKKREDERAAMKKAEDAEIERRMHEYEAKNKELAGKSISEENFWANRDAGRNVLSIIGMALGAFGAVATQGKNLAVEQMNHMIERDLAMQKYNLENEKESLKNQRGILQDWVNLYHDKDLAFAASRATYWNMVGKEIEELGMKNKSEIAKAQIPALLEQTKFQQDKYTAQVAQGLAEKARIEALLAARARAAAAAGAGAAGANSKVTEKILDIEAKGIEEKQKKYGKPSYVKPVRMADGSTHLGLYDAATNQLVTIGGGGGSMGGGDLSVKIPVIGADGKPVLNPDKTPKFKDATAVNKEAVKHINEKVQGTLEFQHYSKLIAEARQKIGASGKWQDDAEMANLADLYDKLMGAWAKSRGKGILQPAEAADFTKKYIPPWAVSYKGLIPGFKDNVQDFYEGLANKSFDATGIAPLIENPEDLTDGYETNKAKLGGTGIE
jgi:hypothetical protein